MGTDIFYVSLVTVYAKLPTATRIKGLTHIYNTGKSNSEM